MAMFLELVLYFPQRIIRFSFEVVWILDISGDLVKQVFMFNNAISSLSILLLHVAKVLDIIKKQRAARGNKNVWILKSSTKYLSKNTKILGILYWVL